MFVEAVRGLRTSLHFTMMDAANRIVVVSGPTQDCGKTLLVARFGKTSVKEIENCLKRLQQMGVQVNGAILNDIVKSAALYYNSGYSHYDYGYTQE
jgi:Mrp family chromosome partitioning ATPase